jgi:hypothetical protein
MLQILAAILCLVFGALVVALGQDRRVKPWFALLCLSCAVLALGHHVETASLRYTFLAALLDATFAPAPRGDVMVKGFSRPVRVFEVDPRVAPAA